MTEKNEAVQELGRLDGLKAARPAQKILPEERSKSARKSARARWDKKRREESS